MVLSLFIIWLIIVKHKQLKWIPSSVISQKKQQREFRDWKSNSRSNCTLQTISETGKKGCKWSWLLLIANFQNFHLWRSRETASLHELRAKERAMPKHQHWCFLIFIFFLFHYCCQWLCFSRRHRLVNNFLLSTYKMKGTLSWHHLHRSR